MKKYPYSLGVLFAWDIAVYETVESQQSTIGQEQYLCGLLKIKDVESHIESSKHITQEEIELYRYEINTLDKIFAQVGMDCILARRKLRKVVGLGNHIWGKETVAHRSEELRGVFGRATELARSFNIYSVNAIHMMEVLFESPTPAIHTMLDKFEIKTSGLVKLIGRANNSGLSQSLTDNAGMASNTVAQFTSPPQASETGQDLLSEIGRDLTALAQSGQLDPLIGRHEEMLQVVRTLTRKTKSNPVLIGDAGVGKTVIVEGLAVRIAEKDISKSLWNHRIVEIRMSALVAGAKYRGDFEERLNQIVEIAENDDKLILFLDELHTLVSASNGSNMDAGNILKPALARGSIRCIGATTFKEYERHVEKDPALSRRFISIRINEPTENEALEIMNGLRASFEKHHALKIEDGALNASVKLSIRYLKDRCLPDKAIDLLDEACAMVKVKTLSHIAGTDGSIVKQDENGNKAIEPVTAHIIAEVVAEKTGIDVTELIGSEAEKFLQLEQALTQRVIGQERAVRTISERLRMAAAGLRDEKKPMAIFLFLGPTGVGKTFLGECIADELFGGANNIIRIDMSEFMEQHSISRLIGAPPGYIGHDEEGQLTGALKQQSYSLVLLDEVEKAHPKVWDIFLQVFDDGRLTDGKGTTVDASHAIFIMTSNIGAGDTAKSSIGFIKPDEDSKTDVMQEKYYSAVKQYFRPEFLNRIDEFVIFNSLDKNTIEAIAKHEIDNISTKLAERSIKLNIESNAYELLIREGFSLQYGARQMRRAVETLIGKPLSEFLLQGEVKAGDLICVTRNNGEITLERKQ